MRVARYHKDYGALVPAEDMTVLEVEARDDGGLEALVEVDGELGCVVFDGVWRTERAADGSWRALLPEYALTMQLITRVLLG